MAFSLTLVASLVAAPAFAEEPRAERARALYAEGKVEFAHARYLEALVLFERSYELSEAPGLLFNMAQAHRLAGPGHCSQAVALYKSYLEALPEAENAREVEERIVELGSCKEQVSPSVEAPADAPAGHTGRAPSAPVPFRAVAVRASKGAPTAPILLSGIGAAVLVAGGVLYARAWDKHREAEQRCPCYPGSYSEWEVLTNVSYAVIAVGGATLATGVSWWVMASPAPNAAPSEAWLGVRGRF